MFWYSLGPKNVTKYKRKAQKTQTDKNGKRKKDIWTNKETEKENKDFYYQWLKKTGLKDVIPEMVEPEEQVLGLRISEEPKKKPCLKISRVTWDNIEHVLNILKYN